ncbi:N-formylglutamate amidohydrolase [Amaricoccus macauensis]|uniref:N-formylglutamate amidohydrolase n=1 Tax=Amaricoccus macauensis TaxID=57001 RepID=UPI003C7E19E1
MQQDNFQPTANLLDEKAFEAAHCEGEAAILLLCDHATNIVPPSVAGGDLGLPPEDMGRHIAFDIGARAVTLELARLLDAPALLTRFSRLVIDPNRGEDDPTLVMRLYDGTIIPANRHITEEEKARRIADWHRPYHQAIDAQIDRMEAGGRIPALISIHSYTPRLQGRAPRPWHVGVLWHHDGRLALPLMERLRAEPDLCIGDNEPYSGQLEGDTMSRHGTGRGLPHVLIELRHDLIETEADQRLWAARLAPILAETVKTAARNPAP